MRFTVVRSRALLRWSALACLVLLAASCSSSDAPAENANYAAVDSLDPSEAATSAGVEPSAQQADPDSAAPDLAGGTEVDEIDLIVSAFDTFLSMRAQAITGDIALDELNAIATPAAIAQVAELRSANDDLIARDSYAALSNLAEWSNISSVVQIDQTFMFTDCTERQFVTPGGATVVHFVTNNVAVVDNDGSYLVDAVIETQDGRVALSQDDFGCVPQSFTERAEAAAAIAVSEAARLIADPSLALESELPEIFSGDARTQLELVLETLNVQGLSRTSDEIVELTVLGIDVHKPEFTVVVSVCRTYPQGRVFTDSNGDETITDLAVGSSYEEWLLVHLDPVPSGSDAADTALAIEDRGPNCQEG